MMDRRVSTSSLKKWFLAFVIYLMIYISLTSELYSLMNVAVILSIAFALIFDISSSILLLLGLTVFENAVKINGMLAWFFIILAIILKYLVVHKFRICFKNKKAISYSLFLSLLAFVTDAITYGIKGQMMTTIELIIFLGLIIGLDEEWKLTPHLMILYLGTTYIFAILYILNQYGGFGTFMDSFLGATYAFRFGSAFGETVGGAMAIPIYSLLILSFSLCILLSDTSKKNMLTIVGIISIDIVALIFGALTISRSFYAGLLIVAILFFLFKTESNKSLRVKITIICLMIFMGIVLINEYYELVFQTINNLFSRLDAGGGTGERSKIWKSCFDYLLNNPIGFIMGFGSNGYPIIGLKKGAMFGAGAHNLYIDILMSWGIIGCVCIIGMIYQMRPNGGYINSIKKNMINFVPLAVLMFFSTTAMRSNSMKTVIYFFCCLIILNNTQEKIVRKGEK